jgi:WD40 repeat protein
MESKSLIISLICISLGSIAMAQKKTPIYLGMLPDNSGAIITYKNGSSYLVGLPDLAVGKTFAPDVPEDRAYQASISPDGKRLAVFHDKSKRIVVWNIESGSVLFEVPVDVGMNFYESIYTFDHSRNQLICKVSAKGNKAHEFNVYDLADGKLVGPMPKLNSKYSIRSFSFSPDGNRVIGYSGSSLDNGELEVFEYRSGEQICEKWMGPETQISDAKFLSNDSVEVKFGAHMSTAYQVARFSVKETEKEIKGSMDMKETRLFFDVRTSRFVVADDVQLSGSYYAPEVYVPSDAQGWLLTVARKSGALTLYDTKNTTDKELNGKTWKEPAQLKSVALP